MKQGFVNRIESLDWLRGLMAIAIMFYHLTSWHISPLDSSNILGRLGIYGVSVFFVLSGLSMAVVYSSFIVDVKTAEIVHSVQGAGEYALSEREILGFGSTASYDSTLNGKVLDLAVREAVNNLVLDIQTNKWSAQ